VPPTINDLNSVPAGTINLKEGSNLVLKCFAEGKPEPMVRWYRWKKYNEMQSEKEELDTVGSELHISKINRNDPNIYECIARNSVPPATSRIFNIEIHCK
jgi:neurotrimin